MNSVVLFLLATVSLCYGQTLSYSNDELGSIPVQNYDVVIVGAGLAGLTAAHRIRQKSPNAKIVILEARNRVGGRIYPVELNGADGGNVTGDLGSIWISPQHTELLSLASELNVDVSKQELCGARTVFIADDDLSPSGKAKRSAEWNTIPGAGITVEELLQNESLIKELDEQSVEEFLAVKNPPIYMKDTINRFLQTFFDTPARNISMLQLMLTVNSEGSSIEELLYNMGHGGSLRFTKHGSQLLQELSKDLDIHFSEPVGEIDILSYDSDTKVLVTTVTGQSYVAKTAIVAVPPTRVSDIAFLPKLDDNRSKLYDNYSPKGDAFYFTATFESPSWRQSNKSGQLIFADNAAKGPILWATTFDITAGDCTADTVTGQLYGIAHFDYRNPALTAEERYAQYEEVLRKSFDNTTFSIVDIRDHQWSSDELSQGAVGALGCNSSQYLSAFTDEPHQMRVFFASAELSKRSMGMMNGAVVSGQKTADEVLSLLQISLDTPVLTKAPEFSPVTPETTTSSLFTIVTAQSSMFNYQTSTVHPPPTEPSTTFDYKTSTAYPIGTFEKIDEMNEERKKFGQQWNLQQSVQQRQFDAPGGIGGGALPVHPDQLISQLEQEIPFIPQDDRLRTIARLNNLIKSLLDQMVIPN